MKIIKRGKKPNTITMSDTYRVECQHCNSIIDVESDEIHISTYSGNNYIVCPVCENNIIVEESDKLTTEELKYMKKSNRNIKIFSIIYLILIILFFIWLILK